MEEQKKIELVDEIKLLSKDGLYELSRNGKPMECPFYCNPLYSCSSRCPLFLIREKSDKSYIVTLGCGNGHTEHAVKEITQL